MAMTATIALSTATSYINQVVNCSLTVSNSSGSTVSMTSITPTVKATGDGLGAPAGLGLVPLSTGFSTSVAASGSTVFTFSVVLFSPSATTYDVGAQCLSSDGSSFAPTATTLTVLPLPLPASEL